MSSFYNSLFQGSAKPDQTNDTTVAEQVPALSDNFKNNIANHITIDIYGKNDQAYGGDVLFITMSEPKNFSANIPDGSTPLNKSNYNILNAFINQKLSPDFKNAFNKDITSGTKSLLSRVSNLGNAKAEVSQLLNRGSINDLSLKNAIVEFSRQLQNLDKNNYPDTDTSNWRILQCTVNYPIIDAKGSTIDNWNKKDLGTVYDLIRGKDKSQNTPVALTDTDKKTKVAGLLGELKNMITPAKNLPSHDQQIKAISNIIGSLQDMKADILNNLYENLTYMFGPIDNSNTPRIQANKYRHLFWDDANKLFYTKSFDWRGNAQKSTSPLSENDLQTKLTTKILVQMGGKTKKHNKLHKKQRKTNKK